eukprot:scaffold125712_cov21-Tisochrysis_lutea.AAC.1
MGLGWIDSRLMVADRSPRESGKGGNTAATAGLTDWQRAQSAWVWGSGLVVLVNSQSLKGPHRAQRRRCCYWTYQTAVP